MSNLTMVVAADDMADASVADVHKILLDVKWLKKEKSLDVHVLKDNNYMQGETLNQDRRHACNIDQARFGKEKSTCINAWKEMRTYRDAMGQTIRDLFSQVNNVKDRDLFLFLPLPCKNKVSQRGKTWRLIRDILSLKDTGWGPPSILVGLLH